jgi:hypothetical protein
MASNSHNISRVEVRICENDVINILEADMQNFSKNDDEFYISSCTCIYDDTNYRIFSRIDKKPEVKIFPKTNFSGNVSEIFYGIVSSVFTLENVASFYGGKKMVVLVCNSFSSLLSKTLHNYEIKYERGFGEVVKNMVEEFNIFNLEYVNEEPISGRIFFKNISILNAIRHLAYVRGWCVRFRGKSIFFHPCNVQSRIRKTISYNQLVSRAHLTLTP